MGRSSRKKDVSGNGVPEEAATMRNRILEVAAKLFYRQGFGGTSMNAIAAELSVSAPALYWHFNSKQELCFEAIHAELEDFVTGLRPSSEEPTPSLQLSSFVSAYVMLKLRQSETLKTPGASGVYGQLREALGPSQRASLDALQRQVVSQLREILRRGDQNGEFKVEDVTVTTFAIITLCEYVFSWFDPQGPLSVDDVAAQYQSLASSMVGASVARDAREPLPAD